MKLTDLLIKAASEAAELDGGFHVAALILRVVKDNTTVTLKKDVSPWQTVSTDKLRPVMCGVYHDKEAKAAVSSDGHIILVSPAHYDPLFAGKITDRELNEIEGKYPNWRNVIPAEEQTSPETLLPRETIEEHIRAAYADAKINKNKRKFYAVRLDEDGNVWVNVEYARMMLAFSEENWRRTEKDGVPFSHVCRRSDGAILVVMPYNIYGNKEEQFQYRK